MQIILDMRHREFLKLSRDGISSVFAPPANWFNRLRVLIVGHHISLWFWKFCIHFFKKKLSVLNATSTVAIWMLIPHVPLSKDWVMIQQCQIHIARLIKNSKCGRLFIYKSKVLENIIAFLMVHCLFGLVSWGMKFEKKHRSKIVTFRDTH